MHAVSGFHHQNENERKILNFFFVDSDISATSATSDSDTAQDTTDGCRKIAQRNKSTANVDQVSSTQADDGTTERINDEDTGNRCWREQTLKRRADETKYSDEWYLSSPTKRFRLGSVSKSITCAKLIKKAKKIKLASMFNKSSGTMLVNEKRMTHKSSPDSEILATDDNATVDCAEVTHLVNRQNEVDVIETLPINYSFPDHAAEIKVVNGEMPFRKSSLNNILRYLLNKELEVTRQSVNCKELELAEHLRQTLAYFDEKLKYNDFGIGISEVQNLVTLKVEKDISTNSHSALTPCIPEPELRPAHQRPDVSTSGLSRHGDKQHRGALPACTGVPLPAHQPPVVEKHQDGPLPAHQNPVNNRLPQMASLRKVLPLYVPYKGHLVSLQDRVLTDDRPLDYCTKESTDLAVNLNVLSEKKGNLNQEQQPANGSQNTNGEIISLHEESAEHLAEDGHRISSVTRCEISNSREHGEPFPECE